MNRTKIEWCQNPDGSEGYTWNPITGCLNDCSYCWARGLANGRLKSRMLANDNFALASQLGHDWVGHMGARGDDPFYPRLWPDRVTEILRGHQHQSWHKYPGRGIFVCSMGDLFGQGVPKLWTHQVLDTIRIMQGGNQHWYPTDDRFYLLTKQPQKLGYWSPFPDNCWVGVSVTRNDEMIPAMQALDDIEAKVKYISFEPLLEHINVDSIAAASHYRWLDWLIIGAQTKPTVLPEAKWVEEIISAADNAGVPVFLKDSLKPLIGVYPEIVYPKGVKVTLPGTLRQEMPR